MGTRSTTKILDEQGNHLVTLYRQFDGYPTGHGTDLANFLKARTLVNGFGMDMTAKTHANGMGCLAAQLITALKGDQIGNIYVTNEGDSQEYNYTVYMKDGEAYIRCESEYYGLLYDGKASEFNGETAEAVAYAEDEEEV